MLERYEITARDRLSPMFDMAFDLSAFDMFVAWEKGACLCWPSRKETIQPASFITDRELTVWFSVPSSAIFMKQIGALKPRRYPSLRLSQFCGEHSVCAAVRRALFPLNGANSDRRRLNAVSSTFEIRPERHCRCFPIESLGAASSLSCYFLPRAPHNPLPTLL